MSEPQVPKPAVVISSDISASHPSILQTSDDRPIFEPLEIEDQAAAGIAAAADETKYPTGFKFAMIMISLGLSIGTVGLMTSVISTAIPSITNEFNTIRDIGWYFSAFTLPLCAFQFMFGKIYSMFNLKPIYIISLAVFELGNLLSALAPTSPALVVGRAVSGFGCAGMISGCFVAITQCVPLRQRALFGSLAGTIETVASVCGPLLGGLLTTRLNWRWCFWVNIPLGCACILFTAIFFENPQVNSNQNLPFRQKLAKMDLLGTLVFVPGIVSLLLALQWGGSQYGWGDVRIIVLFIAFAIGIVAFGYLQYRKQDEATLPPRIVTQQSILAGALFCSLCNGSLSIVDYYLPIYFQAVKEVSAARSGILMLPTIVGLAVACLLAGTGITIIGYYTPFMLATSILAPIAAGLMTTITVHGPPVPLIAYQALLGFSVGLGIQSPQVAAQTTLSQADAPMGLSVIMFAQQLGPAIFATLAQTVFTGRLKSEVNRYAPVVNATDILNLGLADIKNYVGVKNLEAVLLGYDKAVTQTFYLPTAMLCMTMIGALAMPWRSVKKKRE